MGADRGDINASRLGVAAGGLARTFVVVRIAGRVLVVGTGRVVGAWKVVNSAD